MTFSYAALWEALLLVISQAVVIAQSGVENYSLLAELHRWGT